MRYESSYLSKGSAAAAAAAVQSSNISSLCIPLVASLCRLWQLQRLNVCQQSSVEGAPWHCSPTGTHWPSPLPLNEPLFALFRASHRLQNRHNDDSNTVYKAAGDSFSFSLCFLVSLLSLPHSAFPVTVQTLRHVISDIFTKKRREDGIQKKQCDMFSCWLRRENEMLF